MDRRKDGWIPLYTNFWTSKQDRNSWVLRVGRIGQSVSNRSYNCTTDRDVTEAEFGRRTLGSSLSVGFGAYMRGMSRLLLRGNAGGFPAIEI